MEIKRTHTKRATRKGLALSFHSTVGAEEEKKSTFQT